MSPALYVGCILAFLPAYGIQFPLAFLAALLFRSNLLVATGLQLITNPLTIWAIYPFTYLVGKTMIDLWGLGEFNSIIGSKAYPLVLGGIFVGLVLALLLDLIYRYAAGKRESRTVNVKRMLEN